MPLRYPGGKTRGVATIMQRLRSRKELLSPFFGGGAVERAFLQQGGDVFGAEIFEPLVNFWVRVRMDRNRVADIAETYLPLSKKRFTEIQRDLPFTQKNGSFERAAMFFVLNRASYSGSTLSGGMSPNHPRFNANAIQNLRKTDGLNNLRLYYATYEHMLTCWPYDMQAYIDPPYYGKKGLYGVKGELSDFDHDKLEYCLRHRTNWLLSYNNVPEIRKLYEARHMVEASWSYGMGKNKVGKELLIWG